MLSSSSLSGVVEGFMIQRKFRVKRMSGGSMASEAVSPNLVMVACGKSIVEATGRPFHLEMTAPMI
jgi:hypothetical protein